MSHFVSGDYLFFEWLSKSYQKENVSNPFSQQFHPIMYAENILS